MTNDLDFGAGTEYPPAPQSIAAPTAPQPVYRFPGCGALSLVDALRNLVTAVESDTDPQCMGYLIEEAKRAISRVKVDPED